MNSQNWAETQASVQSPLQKLIFGNRSNLTQKQISKPSDFVTDCL